MSVLSALGVSVDLTSHTLHAPRGGPPPNPELHEPPVDKAFRDCMKAAGATYASCHSAQSDPGMTRSDDTLFRKIAAHLGNDLDGIEDPDAVAEALEASRRLFKNIRDGLGGDDIDFGKVLEKCRQDRHARVS